MLTICTPTYNREHLLHDLYISLCKQTVNDFEWIIIDDGSTDDTEKTVNKWIAAENEFPIIYIKKENGGKHTAVNIGIEEAKGDYFIIVDSDDYLNEDAVEIIQNEFKKIPDGKYAGIGFNKIFENGDIVGTTFSGNYIDASNLERTKHGIKGDKAEVFFTKVIKKYRFPVFENERFLTEALLWNRIANDGYKIRWINQGFYVCRYQENGLSMDNNSLKSYEGYSLYIKESLTYNEFPIIEKIRGLGVYSFLCHQNGISDKEISKKIDTSKFIVWFSRTLYKIKSRGSINARRKKLRI